LRRALGWRVKGCAKTARVMLRVVGAIALFVSMPWFSLARTLHYFYFVLRLFAPTSRLAKLLKFRARRKFAAAVRAAATRLLRILLIVFIISRRPPRYHLDGPLNCHMCPISHRIFATVFKFPRLIASRAQLAPAWLVLLI
jgi:hypothetical protein